MKPEIEIGGPEPGLVSRKIVSHEDDFVIVQGKWDCTAHDFVIVQGKWDCTAHGCPFILLDTDIIWMQRTVLLPHKKPRR